MHDNPELQEALLARVEDDIVYVLECVLCGLTGEAKSELSDLVASISASPSMAPEYRRILTDVLRHIRDELVLDCTNATARDGLITLRRRVANTRRGLRGEQSKYNYADVMASAD